MMIQHCDNSQHDYYQIVSTLVMFCKVERFVPIPDYISEAGGCTPLRCRRSDKLRNDRWGAAAARTRGNNCSEGLRRAGGSDAMVPISVRRMNAPFRSRCAGWFMATISRKSSPIAAGTESAVRLS